MPLVELYVIIQVGQAIGVWWTIGLLLADSILGGVLMRSQGRATWRRFTEATAAGRMPAREVLDGALVIFGGAFLLTPGFMTDVLGLALLAPPSRAVIRQVILRRFTARFAGAVSAQQFARRRAADMAESPRDADFEGTARDPDPPPFGPDAR